MNNNKIIVIDLNTCAYCLNAIDEYSRTVDHLHPKSRGGLLSKKNKRPCCSTCNELKGDMTVDEFNLFLKSIIRAEKINHRKTIGLYKRMLISTERINIEYNTKNAEYHVKK